MDHTEVFFIERINNAVMIIIVRIQLDDSFLISMVRRYGIKGKRYINTPMKYYYSNFGLRNARLDFRQMEETHLM